MAPEATDGPRPRGEAEWSLRATARPASKQAAAGRRRLLALLALLALVLLGAYLLRERILHSAAATPPRPTPPTAAAAPGAAVGSQGAMLTSLKRSLAEKSAEMALSVRVGSGGKTVFVRGGGLCDFATGGVSMALRYGGSATPARSLEVVSFPGQSYLSLPGLSRLLPGKSWVAVKTPASLAPGSANPGSFLQALNLAGLPVRPLGRRRLHGSEVTGYSVTFPPAALARLQASPAAGALEAVRSLAMTAYFTVGSGLVSQLGVALQMSLSGRAVPVVETVQFWGYGVRAAIGPPPLAKVATLRQLLAKSRGAFPG